MFCYWFQKGTFEKPFTGADSLVFSSGVRSLFKWKTVVIIDLNLSKAKEQLKFWPFIYYTFDQIEMFRKLT